MKYSEKCSFSKKLYMYLKQFQVESLKVLFSSKVEPSNIRILKYFKAL